MTATANRTTQDILGLHHVTALAKDPAQNLDFWTRVLGLRLVKKTVNFDDPGSYHLYFGDRLGRPGTLMTFFPHPHAGRGTDGAPEVAATLFTVPQGSLGWWQNRLQSEGVRPEVEAVFDSDRLSFRDPHGTRVALVEGDDRRGNEAWRVGSEGDVPVDSGITGLDAVVLAVRSREPTERLLTEVFGYAPVSSSGQRVLYQVGAGGPGERLELHVDPSLPDARLGAGSVHHVAFRTADDAGQARVGEAVAPLVRGVSEQRDRNYFRSIYFREPGGVIFEVATDIPGFTVDEDEAELGTNLRLPPQYERARAEIERALPPLRAEQSTKEAV